MPKIKLPNGCKDTVVLAGCQFVDGELPVSNAELEGVANVLVRFHGCEVVTDEAVEESSAKVEAASGSLAAKETKAGEVAAEVKPAAKAEVKAEVKVK